MNITADMVAQFNIHEYVIEASQLGLKPADPYPDTLSTDMGNGQDFIRDSVNEYRAIYSQLAGNIALTILND